MRFGLIAAAMFAAWFACKIIKKIVLAILVILGVATFTHVNVFR